MAAIASRCKRLVSKMNTTETVKLMMIKENILKYIVNCKWNQNKCILSRQSTLIYKSYVTASVAIKMREIDKNLVSRYCGVLRL